MELKPGYMLTDVGVIPEDWEVCCLDLVSKLSSGTTPSRSQQDRYYRNGKYHWVKTTDLNNSRIITTDEKVTQTALDETCLQIYPPGTVFVAMYGGFNQIGRTGILGISAAVNQALIAIQTKPNKLDPEYLIANLNYRVEHWKSVASSSRKDPNITSQDVRNFVLSLPNLEEQRAIATTLSDMDESLGALDRLIAKKLDLKQAAMQQLLTGKKRLPGFSGEWEVKRLGDLTEMGSGGTPTSSIAAYYDGDIPWVSISDMTKGGKVLYSTDRNLTHAGFSNSAAQMFPPGTVLYAMYASLGECSIAGVSLCSSQAILGIQPNKDLDGEFLYYFLISLKTTVKSLGQQGTQSNLNKGMVQDFVLSLPPFPEQSAIATILSDMDAEIASLEARRDKTRSLKQAMMQELLTGKTRLISPGGCHA